MAGSELTPIREALARLEQAGLVQTQPGRHTIVSPIDVREARAAQSVAAAMHELAIREAITNISPATSRRCGTPTPASPPP